MQSTLDAETRGMIEETLDRFVDEVYPADRRLARLKAPSIDYRLHWHQLAELGVLGLTFPEDLGGMGGGVADAAHALRILARALVLEPLADAAVVAAAVLCAGPRPQAAEQAAQAIDGSHISLVVGLPAHGAELELVPVEAGFELRGLVSLVAFADQADQWLVFAREQGSDVPVLLQLPRSQPGVRLTPLRLMDGRPAADLCFDAVTVQPSQVWLRGADAASAWQRTSQLALTALVADAVGIMEFLQRQTGDYLRTRIQFGVAIGSFQALQHRFADMQMDLLEARAMLGAWVRELGAADGGPVAAAMVSALVRTVARAGRRLGHEAIQMHGGMGVTEELVVSHCNARLQVISDSLAAWLTEAAAVPGEFA